VSEISKVKKDFEKTDYKCPECGKPVFKHFHRKDNPYNQTYEYCSYYCFNECPLDCRNCRYCNTHGECDLNFCMNYSGWKPKIRCTKCSRKADNLIAIGFNVYGREIRQLWCNDCIEKQKKEEKERNIRIIDVNYLKRPDE